MTRVLVCALSCLAGCAPPPTTESRYWGPIERASDAGSSRGAVAGEIDDPVGPNGADGSASDSGNPPSPGITGAPTVQSPSRADGGLPGAASTCSLRVTVTTATTGQDYRPRNIGAIWITDGTNRFVKSLAVWAERRASSLAQWNSATSAAGVARNRVDAVSAATSSNHTARTATWNCTNIRREPVPDGTYRVCFEMTESNRGDSPSRFHCVDLIKGPQPIDTMVPDEPNFRARRLQFTPG